MATTEDRREADSGIEIKPVYGEEDAPGELELPGEFPFSPSAPQRRRRRTGPHRPLVRSTRRAP